MRMPFKALLLLVVFVGASAAAAADPAHLEAVQGYLAAARTAKSNADLQRHWSRRRVDESASKLKAVRASKDAKQRAMSLEMLEKMYRFSKMLDVQEPKVTQTSQDGNRTALELEATAADIMKPGNRTRVTGTVWLVNEKGAWKIDDERWNLTPKADAPEVVQAPVAPTAQDEAAAAKVALEPSMKPAATRAFTSEPIYALIKDAANVALWRADPFLFDRDSGKVPPHAVRKFETPLHPRKIYLFYKNAQLVEASGRSTSYFEFDVENEADKPSECARCPDAVFYRIMQNGGGRAVQIVAIRPDAKSPTQVFVFTHAAR